MTRSHSLRARLLLSMLLIFLCGIAGTSTFYFAEVGIIGRDLQERTLQGQAYELLAALRPEGDGRVAFDLPPDWAEVYARRDSKFFFTLYDSAGVAIARSANLDTDLGAPTPRQDGTFGRLYFVGTGAGRLAAITVRAPQGGTLLVARGDAPEETLVWSLLEENLEFVVIVLAPLVLVALALIWLVVAWSMRPLDRASREAAAIGPRALAGRIGTAGLPTEVLPLVAAVNGALDRLAEAYAAERRLTADAAHELRTPLAVLSLRLQRARLDGTVDWPVVEREMAQMVRLIGQLLDLTRKESVDRMRHAEWEPVNLSRVVREAAAMVLPIAEEKGRPVEVEASEPVAVRGRADDLRDMVRNLLDNALVHGAGAVSVVVRPEVTRAGEGAVVEVADEGQGVPPELQASVFERFRKGTASSPGAGLGLAIVRQVARMHGGDVCFLPGPGCRLQIRLPAGGGTAA